MWTETAVYREDLEGIVQDRSIPWEELDGKTILVTGATGLIGFNVVSALLYYGMDRANPPKVLALVRSAQKAEHMFAAQMAQCAGALELVVGDVCSMPAVAGNVDYIIHGASQTASRAFIEAPVETIETALSGTKNLLELAKEKRVRSFVYLSSMEVYGYPEKGSRVTEDMVAGFDTTTVRNCYPLGKQMCEMLCSAYAAQYGVGAKILRLTQTFGPGVSYQDGRVFAEFMRCAMEKRNIVLKTMGETERSYLYTADAVRAVLAVLLRGEDRQAYTAANEDTYCSIAQMAQMVAAQCAGGEIDVVFELEDVTRLGYANTLYMNLDTSKLRALGWQAKTGLCDMYLRMSKACGPSAQE